MNTTTGGEVLGGRDEVAGGTWLACTRHGRLAFLTNVAELSQLPEAKSRGNLPLQFLQGWMSPMEFAKEVLKDADQYNGFNLVLSDLCSKTMVYVTNRPKGESSVQKVSTGIHVLSNAQLDTPWQKAERLGRSFKELLDIYGSSEVPVELMVEKLMTDTTKADIHRLPGVRSFEMEYNVSSIFVEFDTPEERYGTRSTTALSVKASGEVNFYEKYLAEEGWKDHAVTFHIE